MADYVLTGTVSWAHRLFEPEEFMDKVSFSCAFFPDVSSLVQFEGLKLRNTVREDEDGNKYVTLRRNNAPTIWKDKVIDKGGAPEVVDAEGNPWNPEVGIGNGSKVTLKLNVYKSRKGPGSRIVKVRIDELVEYTAPEEATDETGKKAVPF